MSANYLCFFKRLGGNEPHLWLVVSDLAPLGRARARAGGRGRRWCLLYEGRENVVQDW